MLETEFDTECTGADLRNRPLAAGRTHEFGVEAHPLGECQEILGIRINLDPVQMQTSDQLFGKAVRQGDVFDLEEIGTPVVLHACRVADTVSRTGRIFVDRVGLRPERAVVRIRIIGFARR